jgi:NADH dehydrogenase/NADH:ubiquinone oxidoreductase subunit G
MEPSPFRPYERLVTITILGKKFEVPEKNIVLRCFQYLSPETIPYGRFCWNQECQTCRVSCRVAGEQEARQMLTCKVMVREGMEIIELSPELLWNLKRTLNLG